MNVDKNSDDKRPKESHVVAKIICVKNGSFWVLKRMFPLLPGEYATKDLDWKSFVGVMRNFLLLNQEHQL
jgi:hypothetical protein